MHVLEGLPASELQRGGVAFGNFDGVHLGHRSLIASLQEASDGLPGGTTVVTFDPHPLRLLRPERAPAAIDTLSGRLLWLERCGVDRVVVLRFDADLMARSAEWFAAEVLFGRLHAGVLFAGYDSRFGHGGRGDLALLRATAAEVGAEVRDIVAVEHGGEVVSSSRVRKLISAGEIEQAGVLLARPFCLRGEVIAGDARGRTIGFPTANIATVGQVQPSAGVYASRLEVDGQLLDAVCNVGTRPTVSGDSWRVEAHVLDFRGDLYDRTVALHFVARLREERRFDGLDALKDQIGRDCEHARQHLAR